MAPTKAKEIVDTYDSYIERTDKTNTQYFGSTRYLSTTDAMTELSEVQKRISELEKKLNK